MPEDTSVTVFPVQLTSAMVRSAEEVHRFQYLDDGLSSLQKSLSFRPFRLLLPEVLSLLMNVSLTGTGIPCSFKIAFAAHGIIPISVCSAFQHWIAAA